MQGYSDIPSTTPLSQSRQKILDNIKTAMSCSSGTAFPTTNLVQGMLCIRTDLNHTPYKLVDVAAQTWETLIPVASGTVSGTVKIGANLTITNGVLSAPAPYSLPVATNAALGGVKVGTTLTITAGVLDVGADFLKKDGSIAMGTGYVPTVALSIATKAYVDTLASASAFGRVKVGSNITVTDGVISVPAASATVAGVVKVGDGLAINAGVLSASSNAVPHGSQMFTTVGASTFTVPAGVSTIHITGCGGGGAGHYSSTNGGAGGTTSFGALLSLSGGGGGSSSAGTSGGWGGQAGWQSGYYYLAGSEADYYYYAGGDTLFGIGGKSMLNTLPTGYGAGGKGRYYNRQSEHGGGGGQCAFKQAINVIPGQSYTITVGAGGINTANAGCNGTQGFILVEW